jgi:hypothetical protein
MLPSMLSYWLPKVSGDDIPSSIPSEGSSHEVHE